MKWLPGENRSNERKFFPIPLCFDPHWPMVKPSPTQRGNSPDPHNKFRGHPRSDSLKIRYGMGIAYIS
jgi:hypothetical protein